MRPWSSYRISSRFLKKKILNQKIKKEQFRISGAVMRLNTLLKNFPNLPNLSISCHLIIWKKLSSNKPLL